VIAGDGVKVMVTVPASAERAFAYFVSEIDHWWRRGPKYRVAGRNPGTLTIEPRTGGRVFEAYADDAPLHETGEVLVYEPPHRLHLSWRVSNFAPGEVTYVEVSFTSLGPARTRVELVHRGFAAIRPDHPVRHGAPPVEFARTLGLWWGELLTSYREHLAGM